MNSVEIDRAATARPAGRSFGWIGRLIRHVARRQRARRKLVELSQLDQHMLRDMGITPRDIRDAMDGRQRSLLFDPVRRDD